MHVLAADEGAADRSERIVREVLEAAFASWPVVDDVLAEPTFTGALRDIARSWGPMCEALGSMSAGYKVRPYRPPYAKTLMEAVYGKGV